MNAERDKMTNMRSHDVPVPCAPFIFIFSMCIFSAFIVRRLWWWRCKLRKIWQTVCKSEIRFLRRSRLLATLQCKIGNSYKRATARDMGFRANIRRHLLILRLSFCHKQQFSVILISNETNACYILLLLLIHLLFVAEWFLQFYCYIWGYYTRHPNIIKYWSDARIARAKTQN